MGCNNQMRRHSIWISVTESQFEIVLECLIYGLNLSYQRINSGWIEIKSISMAEEMPKSQIFLESIFCAFGDNRLRASDFN